MVARAAASRWGVVKRPAAALAVVGLLAGLLATSGSPGISTTATADEAGAGPWSATKTLERVFRDPETGEDRVVDSRRVTVRVSKTQSLRGRERIRVSWDGARPSAARAASPFGEEGLAQEYPVVILQCRGVDDPSVPAERRLSPETCWTSTRAQRSQSVVNRTAVWRHDLFATEQDRAQKSGPDPFPAAACDDIESFSSRVVPFRAASGRIHLSCTAETMAPEAAVGAAFPPAEQAAFTDLDGRGETQFEVRSAVENESLGCSHEVDCTLVVIPIMGISCLDADAECRKRGRFVVGSSNFAKDGIDASVGPAYWWSESNWRHRFSVPLDFGLPPDACDVLDTRPPVGFYGSELMSQAALQWSPSFCLRKDRFKFQHNRMPDEQAFALMEKGEGVAALVSGQREAETDEPVGYAPTAVTGFGVGYVIDRPDNAGEYTSLRLNARLLAKLLTQSYPASPLGQQRPGLESNPVSMNVDPEFIALNPGLDRNTRESMATVISLSEASDVLTTLTDYLDSDPDARAFIEGKPDPWGMKVNPAYRDIDLPRDEWPLLDTYVPTTTNECLLQNPAPYLSKVAAPTTSLRKIAEAVLDGWPNVQTKCERATFTDPWKVGRVDRQGVGTRMVLGIVSLGDAARFGLRTAALQTSKGTFVTPTDTAILNALKLGKQSESSGVFAWTQQQVRRAGNAYPGAQVVYTAARLRGMSKSDAALVAQFIRVGVTEAQERGPGNGQLPGGYVPLARTGATARYHSVALRVADLIEKQAGLPGGGSTKPTPGPGPGTGSTGDGPTGGGDLPAAVPPGEEPSPTGPDPVAPPAVEATAQVVATVPVSSSLAGGLLPMLLVLVGAAAVASVGLQIGFRFRRTT